MPRPPKPNMPNYKNMQVTEENHRQLTELKPYDRPMREWFNEQLAAFIEFKKHTKEMASA